MKNVIIWIEDRPDTVAGQISFCKGLGFDVKVTGTVHRLAELLKTEKNRTRLIIMDIMLFSVMSLDSIEIKGSHTDDGYRAGWVIIDRFLRPKTPLDGMDDYKNIPILIASTRKQTDSDESQILELTNRGGAWIDYIEKGGLDENGKISWIEQFENKIKELHKELMGKGKDNE